MVGVLLFSRKGFDRPHLFIENIGYRSFLLLVEIGIDVRNTQRPVATLSGGERQSVAISRAVYFGAKVLILDDPTSALGVTEAGVVLRISCGRGRVAPASS